MTMLYMIGASALLLVAPASTNAQPTFSPDAAFNGRNLGRGGAMPGAERETNRGTFQGRGQLNGRPAPAGVLERQALVRVGTFTRTCPCIPAPTVELEDIRVISNTFVAGGNAVNTFGLTNMV
eukprot:jgi/Ulvmu1/3966/UM180_0007.1